MKSGSLITHSHVSEFLSQPRQAERVDSRKIVQGTNIGSGGVTKKSYTATNTGIKESQYRSQNGIGVCLASKESYGITMSTSDKSDGLGYDLGLLRHIAQHSSNSIAGHSVAACKTGGRFCGRHRRGYICMY